VAGGQIDRQGRNEYQAVVVEIYLCLNGLTEAFAQWYNIGRGSYYAHSLCIVSQSAKNQVLLEYLNKKREII
jgi:hypothetical protein